MNETVFEIQDTEALLIDALEKLYRWYQKNKRDLPWRKVRDPYSIWISEIMLQQTRVEAVKEYYHRFLAALPTVRSLAEAPEEQVLKLWEGLGYYSRAANLRKAAQKIVSDYDGVFPRDFAQIRSLPGIGEYTAGAIASIAFEQPVPAVDGNVLRVLSRLLNDERSITEQKTKTAMTELLKRVYPKTHCGDTTQSLMELGAVVCVPNGQPQCGVCPWASICRAKEKGTAASLPVKSAKAKRKIEQKTVFLLQCGDCYAIRKRAEKGLLFGMWEFPNAAGHLKPKEIQNIFPAASHITAAGSHRHIFTHIEWELFGYVITLPKEEGCYQWLSVEEIKASYAIPRAFWPFFQAIAAGRRDQKNEKL